MFHRVPASASGVNFQNTLVNSDDFNIIEYLYFYNGGGVAVGDINNDGLADIYFSANQQPNRLYLNKGNFKFEDITDKAGVEGVGNWKTGVTMADVNADGFLDLFLCGVGNYKSFNSENQLLINNGDLTFSDRTEDHGLKFKGFSTQASFFDYDNDGDLDMYLVNHSVHTRRSYGHGSLRLQSDSLAGDKLYQNQLIPSGKAYFLDVTTQSGILNSQIAYGLAVGVSDLDNDGYLDIYVSNDFNENDYLYINQRNGTFRQEIENSIPHSSRFSMGNDIADINNDGRPDIITLDMLPKDEAVIKTTAAEDAYEIYKFRLEHGYHYQFLRNTLQLNRGLDAENRLLFSDIAAYAGIEATDWSWAPLIADYDNDGAKDLFVSNGIVGRPNDLDYINFISRDSSQRFLNDAELFEQMPSGSVPNVFFRNEGDMRLVNKADDWIETTPSVSNGAAYGDLDNDGDLDLVVNNINAKAFLFRNDAPRSNYLKFVLKGNSANRFGVGAQVVVHTGGAQIIQEQIPTRGWMSSVDYVMHIGLGSLKVDSIVVRWPGRKVQVVKNVAANSMLVLDESNASLIDGPKKQMTSTILEPGIDISFKHDENEFVAFDVERLIPHMLSTEGPKLAVSDVNGDGREDFFVGGASGQPGQIFLQAKNGTFTPSIQPALENDSAAEDVDAAFADVDGNGSPDLIVVSGGQQYKLGNKNLLPRLYLNDGRGSFVAAEKKLPEIYVNASCIKPVDFDADGDVDLFVGGRVVPEKYGIDPSSYFLQNNGAGIFSDVTSRLLGENSPLGMVTDAEWIDLNHDDKIDLIVVGEWMPITVLIQNEAGGLDNETDAYGLQASTGWWNTIATGDFDKDGNIDFVAGNLGTNARLKASEKEPVEITIGDIDNNNSLDHIITYYNQGKRYPFLTRDQLVKQLPAMRRQFLKYANFKDVQLENIIGKSTEGRYIHKSVQTFASTLIMNRGDRKFELIDLPKEAQWFPIYAIEIDDFDNDTNSDLMVIGNLDATQPDFGRYDAGYGLILTGDEKGHFSSVDMERSGFIVRGQGRDIATVKTVDGELYLVSRNGDSIKTFSNRLKRSGSVVVKNTR